MARDSEHVKRRNGDLMKDYERLRALKDGKARRYTWENVIYQLSRKYYLSEYRVRDIVLGK